MKIELDLYDMYHNPILDEKDAVRTLYTLVHDNWALKNRVKISDKLLKKYVLTDFSDGTWVRVNSPDYKKTHNIVGVIVNGPNWTRRYHDWVSVRRPRGEKLYEVRCADLEPYEPTENQKMHKLSWVFE